MAHDIFISYSSKDKPIADGICANLEAAGFRCWIAPRDIAAGDDWPTAITSAISKSQVMVLVFSANSNSSKDVGREIILAANGNLTIIPFKIEDVNPEPGKEYYLARTHWLEAMNPPTKDQIQALVERVRALVQPVAGSGIVETPAANRQTETMNAPSEKKESDRSQPAKKVGVFRQILYIGVPLVLVLLGVFLWPKIQEMTSQPEGLPTVTASITQVVDQTETLQPISTDLPTDAPSEIPAVGFTEQASAPASVFHYSLLKTLSGHTAEVTSVAFSNDGKTLASGSKDQTIIVWDVATLKATYTLEAHTDSVNSVDFDPALDDVLVSGSDDGQILLWNYKTGDLMESIPIDQTGGVHTLVFSKDGHYLASSTDDEKVVLWNIQNAANGVQAIKLLTIWGFPNYVRSIAFSPDGNLLASSSYKDSSFTVNETSSGNLLKTLNPLSGDILNLAFSPDGSILASASSTVVLWETSSWKQLNILTGLSVAFSPDGSILAVGMDNGSINIVELSTGKTLVSIKAYVLQDVKNLAFSPDGTLLASGSVDGLVKIWDLDY
jgi:WD40 repeat protein